MKSTLKILQSHKSDVLFTFAFAQWERTLNSYPRVNVTKTWSTYCPENTIVLHKMCFRYLDLDHKKRIVEEYLPKQTIEHLKKLTNAEHTDTKDESEPPKKKQKLKGRNKQVSGSISVIRLVK